MADKNYGVEHFELVQIHLPYVSGVCTPPAGSGWGGVGFHTPLTCVESSNGIFAYTFGDISTPIGYKAIDYANGGELSTPIYRQIKSLSENTAEIKPESGMASRGNMKVTFDDFAGDPGPVNRTEGGTYFSKFLARNIFNNREVFLIRGVIDAGVVSIVSTSSYIADGLVKNSNGSYTLTCKSHLDRTYKESNQFPEPTGAQVRADINETTTTIPVIGSQYSFSAGQVIRIGDELLVVNSVNGSGNSQTLSVPARGSSIGLSGGVVSKVEAEPHDEGDDIQVCYVSDNQRIPDFLRDVLLASGIKSSYINIGEWRDEINDYWLDTFISNIWSEPIAAKALVDNVCADFMIDLWEDPTIKQIKISSVSTWKKSSTIIKNGAGITEGTLRSKSKPDLRASRCYVYYDKRFKTANEDRGNYKKLAVYADVQYDSEDFYGMEKVVELPSSTNHTFVSASLRTQRHVARFSVVPRQYSWDCEEKYLDYLTGDVVSFTDDYLTDAAGNPASVRAQVTKIQPKYNQIGRLYSVSALTYLAAIDADGAGGAPVFTLTGQVFDLNLWVHAGGPPDPVDVIFIFDGSAHGATRTGVPAVKAGRFAAGSTITIILRNGAAMLGKGGDSGDVYFEYPTGVPLVPNIGTPENDGAIPTAKNATNGSDSYLSDGVTTSIYLDGTYVAPSGSIYNADGRIYAPGGGGGSVSGFSTRFAENSIPWHLNYAIVEASGGAGAGFEQGEAGSAGISPIDFNGVETNPDWVVFGVSGKAEGIDGNVFGGGAGRTVEVESKFNGLSAEIEGVTAIATSGKGGNYGENGVAAQYQTVNPTGLYSETFVIGQPGIAGGAIRGGNVTVYTDGTAGRLIEGNSSNFTTVIV